QSCNNGQGKLVYEKISDYRLSGLQTFGNKPDREICWKNALEGVRKIRFHQLTVVIRLILHQENGAQVRISRYKQCHIRQALTLDTNFQPNSVGPAVTADYEDSQCILHFQRSTPDGDDALIKQPNAWHFNEVCLSSRKLSTDCSNRLIPDYRFDGVDDKEVFTKNRTECEDLCLNDTELPCRSASFDRTNNKCTLSRETRYMNSRGFKVDGNSDYVENMCLKSEFTNVLRSLLTRDAIGNQLCTATAFILETSKELEGAYERELITAQDFQECSNYCLASLEDRGFLCRSFMFDDKGHTCVLYDEDPLFYGEIENDKSAQPNSDPRTDTRTAQQPTRPLKASTGNLYRVLCVNAARGENAISNATLECHRRKRLDGPHEVEITTYSFYDCLEECTRRYGKNCKSVEYSSQHRLCRFSSGHIEDYGSMNLVDDPSYDYYKFIWCKFQVLLCVYVQTFYILTERCCNTRFTPDPLKHSTSQNTLYYQIPPKKSVLLNRSSHLGGYNPTGMSPAAAAPSSAHLQAGMYSDYGYGYPQSGMYNPWRDPHRGGFGYDRQPQPPPFALPSSASSFASRHGTFSGNYGNYGPMPPHYPGGGGGGYMPPPSLNPPSGAASGAAIPVPQSAINPSPVAPGPPPGGMPPPGYGIPYHAHGFPPLAGVPNSISAPFPPPPFPGAPGLPADRCKFPSNAPFSARFNRIGFGSRLRNTYIFKVIKAEKLEDCERACVDSRDFVCRSFNYRAFFQAENCELSQYDSKQLKLDNPQFFEQHTQYDYYERDAMGGMGQGFQAECLEVSQTCTPDGMEFTLKTPEGFFGRIYTYGFYDSCFYDGNGGTVSVLRISRANGFPRCGTQQYGDAMTNIVVVQFNDFVQTSRDKKYNLTCYFSGPGEAVVTSNYLDTKTDGRYPTQIEHLPAQNILTSNVVLRILYRGTPTNTIVVGDLLTFRLEARGHYRYDYYNSDIFATNVIAKDPYTGRQVHLIDGRGCPVDLYVFPELHKTPDGALEAEFYAFKIPDSNFLVFQATVRTCRGPCEPVICADRGRGHGSFPSWGRKKRSVNGTEALHEAASEETEEYEPTKPTTKNGTEEEEVHELLRVYLSREDIPSAESEFQVMEKEVSEPSFCIAQSGYYTLITAVTLLTTLLIVICVAGLIVFRRTKFTIKENRVEATNPNLYVSQFHKSSMHQKFDDPSEPIYTDPSLFERSRSLRSLTISSLGTTKQFPDE
ncbi:uncharacterized protein B4U80_08834, partial [Leptotrombidium deliense]